MFEAAACNVSNNTKTTRKKKAKENLRTHVVFSFLLVELTLFFRRCILVLLVLRYKIIHVAFCFREFHLIHALPSVPMQECFTPEHCCEVFGNSLEHFLNSGRVS